MLLYTVPLPFCLHSSEWEKQGVVPLSKPQLSLTGGALATQAPNLSEDICPASQFYGELSWHFWWEPFPFKAVLRTLIKDRASDLGFELSDEQIEAIATRVEP
jgi:hypothetical protein